GARGLACRDGEFGRGGCGAGPAESAERQSHSAAARYRASRSLDIWKRRFAYLVARVMSTGTARAQNRVSDIWPRRSADRVYAVYARGGDRFLWRLASHWRRDARARSLRACRRRHRGSVVDADTAQARELHRGGAHSPTRPPGPGPY